MSASSENSDNINSGDSNALAPMWIPDRETIARSNINATLAGQSLGSYEQLYRWSIDEPEAFWAHVTDTLRIRFARPPQRVLDLGQGPTAPIWLPGARLNIAESCFQAEPDAPAIVHGGPEGTRHTLSYREVRRLANRVANGLPRVGIEPGDAVAVFMPMTARSVSIYLGIILAGCTVVSIADSFSAEQVRTRLKIGNAKAIFTAAFVHRGNKQLKLFERAVCADGPRAVIVDDVTPEQVTLRPGDLNWFEFLGDETFDPVIHAEPDAPVNVLFSSGTTGEPKAIPWDHTTPIKAAADGYFHHDIHPGDVIAWPTSLGWMMGPWLIFATMINRGTIALFDGPPAGEAFGRFVQDVRVNMLGVVPSMVRHWRQSACMERLDFSAIRAFSSTGECSNPQDMGYLSQLAGGKPIIEYCGGTEIGGGYITSTVVQPNVASAFSTPAIGNAFVILDEEGQPSDMGELFLVAPAMGLSRRLLNRDHHAVYHEGAPIGPNGASLRRHGDQVQALEDGYFRILGRADDTMNLSGIKVGAAEIERVLTGTPGVAELAAIAVPPPDGGPARLIICAGTGSSTPPDAADLQAVMQQAIKSKLNPLFKIHEVYMREHLPRTASNKIIRRQLRQQYEDYCQGIMDE